MLFKLPVETGWCFKNKTQAKWVEKWPRKKTNNRQFWDKSKRMATHKYVIFSFELTTGKRSTHHTKNAKWIIYSTIDHGRMKIHYNGIHIHCIVYITLVLIWYHLLIEDCINKEGKKSIAVKPYALHIVSVLSIF